MTVLSKESFQGNTVPLPISSPPAPHWTCVPSHWQAFRGWVFIPLSSSEASLNVDVLKCHVPSLCVPCLKASCWIWESLADQPAVCHHFRDRDTKCLWHSWWCCWQQTSSDINTPTENSSEKGGCEELIVLNNSYPIHGSVPPARYSHRSRRQSSGGWTEEKKFPGLRRTPCPHSLPL